MTELAVTQYFTYWRSIALGSRDVVEGLVAREHLGPSPALARALADWDGYYYWESTGEARWLVLVAERSRPRERWWLHAALFLLTLLSTAIAGATLAGSPLDWAHPSLAALRTGLPFALPLAAILLAHESGHYVAARKYRVNASPPYFIPFPSFISLLGTLGAFIRVRSPIFDRRTLFDIGAAGPLAGMLVAVPVLLVGLAKSQMVAAAAPMLTHQFIEIAGERFLLGDSLLLAACRALVGAHGMLRLHPLAMAGWAGVLVTTLNLLPLAQLDGGHVAYATFGRAQTWIARFFWLSLIPLGRLWWGWWLWAVLGLIIGRGRLQHPRVIAPERPLDRRRIVVAWATAILFAVTFMPLPLRLGTAELPLEGQVAAGVSLHVAHGQRELPLDVTETPRDRAVAGRASDRSGSAPHLHSNLAERGTHIP